jgi:proteasome assembly chaperone 3
LNENPTDPDTHLISDRSNDDSLLPSSRFTPRTLLGAGGSDREMIGHLYASQIASAVTTKTPTEKRSLSLGLGLAKVSTSREVFLEIIDLVLKCI